MPLVRSLNRAPLALSLSLLCGAIACGGDIAQPDAGVDGGAPDSGAPDAGHPDAGNSDAGIGDAGPDAGLDAGPDDAGLPDAGSPDAGLDAGNDAGLSDAGADAGADAGPIATRLPLLPAMRDVVAAPNDDSVEVTFAPVDGAADYRIYPLPHDQDIAIDGGSVVVKNAIYRCAGTRESPPANLEVPSNLYCITTQLNQSVGGYQRSAARATLGYVYTKPGAGLVPVYALGDADHYADANFLYQRWGQSRAKLYTTSTATRAQLLAAFARDDGIAFYVPAASSAATTQIYLDEDQVGTPNRDRYYFAAGPEAAQHASKSPAFLVLTSAAAGTEPLIRVFYRNNCGWSHDELAVGQGRFQRAYQQGDQGPAFSVLWTGLTAKTTLVVEALDKGCPYQGHLSPQPVPQVTAYFGAMPLVHQPFQTLDLLRANSPTTEVFINGQAGAPWIWDRVASDGGSVNAPSGIGTPLPNAIARSFITVAPQPHAAMDFFDGFGADGGTQATFAEVPCGVAGGNCYATWRQRSAKYDQMFINAEYLPGTTQGLYAFGQEQGEWWISYGDVGADTNGKYRLTALQKATMNDATYLHATMEVDGVSSTRRYPQLIISDQDIPVQYNLASGHSLVVQLRALTTPMYDYPVNYELQICSLRTWDVNNQCPGYDLYDRVGSDGAILGTLPGDEVSEHVTADRRTLFDVYASTQRVYLFLDGQPYACANLPASGAPKAGPVTVTWGDVLYHSAVDHTFAFHANQMQIDTRRHFDNLGFSSGVPAPAWDETRLPCAAPVSP
jgi:hypothetical protein